MRWTWQRHGVTERQFRVYGPSPITDFEFRGAHTEVLRRRTIGLLLVSAALWIVVRTL